MSRKTEILFMKTRLIRLATERWNLKANRVIDIFRQGDILKFIELGYDTFHCEGDEAVFNDIMDVLKSKGVEIC